jgi:DNA invertase Pin-like site-specific DNA recombinase
LEREWSPQWRSAQRRAMFAIAARREFDLLLVRSLDRFSREGMVATIGHLQRLASLAKLEREKISQRT